MHLYRKNNSQGFNNWMYASDPYMECGLKHGAHMNICICEKRGNMRKKKMYNAEIHNLHSSTNVFRMIS
jgi:hypothetical protein